MHVDDVAMTSELANQGLRFFDGFVLAVAAEFRRQPAATPAAAT